MNGHNSTWQGQIFYDGLNVVSSSGTDGILTLEGNNDYSGGTTIGSHATLSVGSDANLGYDTGRVTFDNGTLRTSAEVIFNDNRDMTLNAGRTGTLDTQGYHSWWNGLIEGAGTLNVTGGGIFSLTSTANTYSGGTSIGGGSILDVAGDGSLGSSTSTVTLDNGTLQASTGIIFDANRNLVLGAGNGTFNTLGYGSSWNGIISGSGGLSITGGGALLLGNNNIYTGLTDVSAAWLFLGADDALVTTNAVNVGAGGVLNLNSYSQTLGSLSGSGGVSLNGGTLTIGTDDSSGLFSGEISGGGSLMKTGAGTFTLTGSGDIWGNTAVEEGVLMVGDASSTGAVLQGSVTVADSARLGGWGTINGTVTNSGTVQPGGSSGVLNITQLNQGPDSLLEIDVLPANYQSGRLSVGNASLDGSVTVVLTGGDYGIRYRYVILTSAGSLGTTFDLVSASATFMTPSLTYGTNAVTLTLLRDNVDFETLFAQTPNQTALAGVLNESILTASDEFIEELNGLYMLSPEAGRLAMDQMSGSYYLPLAGIMLNNHLFANRVLFGHAAGSGSAMPSAVQSGISRALAFEISPDAPAASHGLQAAALSPRLWVESHVSSGTVDGNSNVVGYKTQKYGFVAAYDTPLSGDFKAGLSAAYNRLFLDSADSASSQTRVDNTLLGIYGGPSFGDWDITAAVQYGLDKYQTNRLVSIGPDENRALADFNGSEISATLQMSSKLLNDPAFNLKSKFGAQYTHLSMDGFTETGAGALNLTIPGQTYDSMKPFAGLDGAGNVALGGNTVLTPMAGLSLYRELNNLSSQLQTSLAGAPGINYTVTGVTPTQLMLGVEAGAKLVTGRGFNLYAAFNGYFGGNQSSNALHGGAGFNF